jgi:uncharacterized low-complexity protein
MLKKTSDVSIPAVLGTAFAVSLASIPVANAQENPFRFTGLTNGYMVAEGGMAAGVTEAATNAATDAATSAVKDAATEAVAGAVSPATGTEAAVGEKCEGDADCCKDDKCKEGSCGAEKMKAKEGKCGEGKCGGNKKEGANPAQ